MARMDYDTFREYCLKNVIKAMGEEAYEADFITIRRSDEEEHDSVQIKERGQTNGTMHSFRIKPFYLDYYDGKPLGEVMLDIIKTMEEELNKTFEFDMDIFDSFEKAKDNLILRPLNYFRCKKLLADHVFQRHEDIALVLYTRVQLSGEGMASAKIPRKTAEEWMVGEPFMMQTAMENTVRMFPPFIVPLEVVFKGAEEAEKIPANQRFFMNPVMSFSLKPSMINTYYLSIDKGINGAVAVFYPGVLDRLCAILNDDLYITLNSVRDAFVHVASHFSAAQIKGMGMTGSANPGISKDDFLSDSVYVYRRAERTLRILK